MAAVITKSADANSVAADAVAFFEINFMVASFAHIPVQSVVSHTCHQADAKLIIRTVCIGTSDETSGLISAGVASSCRARGRD